MRFWVRDEVHDQESGLMAERDLAFEVRDVSTVTVTTPQGVQIVVRDGDGIIFEDGAWRVTTGKVWE